VSLPSYLSSPWLVAAAKGRFHQGCACPVLRSVSTRNPKVCLPQIPARDHELKRAIWAHRAAPSQHETASASHLVQVFGATADSCECSAGHHPPVLHPASLTASTWHPILHADPVRPTNQAAMQQFKLLPSSSITISTTPSTTTTPQSAPPLHLSQLLPQPPRQCLFFLYPLASP
jgi:hypothetical protein